MAKENFVESAHCTHNSRCKTCRDVTETGFNFRKSLMGITTLPGNNVNFDCPYGIKWRGDKPEDVIVEPEKENPVPAIQSAPVTSPAPQGQAPKKSGCGCGGSGSVSVPTGQAGTERMESFDFVAKFQRKQCPDCTRKHIAQAAVLLQESLTGHFEHRWLAVAHLAEAESECLRMWPDLGANLAETRMRLVKEKEFMPDNLMGMIEEISRRDEQMKNGSREQLSEKFLS